VGDVAEPPEDVRDAVQQFIDGLSGEERMLIVLNRELYQGSWDEMADDLKARLEGRPYIFKLAHRIADDLDRIERLRGFELRYKITLSDFVKLQ